MILIYGTKSKTVQGDVIGGVHCPNCGNSQFASYGVLSYFYLYWIPFFLTSKTIGIICTSCQRDMSDEQIPPEVLPQIKKTVASVRNIIPMFSGLILIVLLISGISFYGKYEDRKELTYLEQPLIEDMYVVDFSELYTGIEDEYKYGLLRVQEVTHEAVILQVSKLVYNMTSGVTDDIKKGKASSDSYYEEEMISIYLESLKELKTSCAIRSVER